VDSPQAGHHRPGRGAGASFLAAWPSSKSCSYPDPAELTRARLLGGGWQPETRQIGRRRQPRRVMPSSDSYNGPALAGRVMFGADVPTCAIARGPGGRRHARNDSWDGVRRQGAIRGTELRAPRASSAYDPEGRSVEGHGRQPLPAFVDPANVQTCGQRPARRAQGGMETGGTPPARRPHPPPPKPRGGYATVLAMPQHGPVARPRRPLLRSLAATGPPARKTRGGISVGFLARRFHGGGLQARQAEPKDGLSCGEEGRRRAHRRTGRPVQEAPGMLRKGAAVPAACGRAAGIACTRQDPDALTRRRQACNRGAPSAPRFGPRLGGHPDDRRVGRCIGARRRAFAGTRVF